MSTSQTGSGINVNRQKQARFSSSLLEKPQAERRLDSHQTDVAELPLPLGNCF